MTLPPTFHHLEPTTSSLGKAIARRVRVTLLAVTFWSAIVLPVLYVPLLATGLDTVARTVAFLVLFGLNVVALVVGHPYRPD